MMSKFSVSAVQLYSMWYDNMTTVPNHLIIIQIDVKIKIKINQ